MKKIKYSLNIKRMKEVVSLGKNIPVGFCIDCIKISPKLGKSQKERLVFYNDLISLFKKNRFDKHYSHIIIDFSCMSKDYLKKQK